MSNPGLGFQGAILGFKEESTWGVAVTPDHFLELVAGKVEKDIAQLHSGSIPKVYVPDTEMAQGMIKTTGEFEVEARYEGIELLLKHAMGAQADAEVASFIVTGSSNDRIDFNIGAGDLVATITPGTYAAGLTQATAGSLCKAIYDAIVAAEAVGTYTVSFSATTKKFTITRSAGTFNVKFATGTNVARSIGSLLGFAATDLTGALTYTSATAVTPIYSHTFTLADALPTGLTFELDEDISASTIVGGKINNLGLSIDTKGFLKAKVAVVAKDKTYAAATSPQTLPTAPLVLFHQGVLAYNGTTVGVENVEITLANKLKDDRAFIGSRLISEPMRNGKIEVTGKFTMEFLDNAAYDDFVAATSRSLTLTFTGPVIKGALTYSITITLPKVKPTKVTPAIKDGGVIHVEVPFKAYATDSSTREMSIVVQNRLATN